MGKVFTIRVWVPDDANTPDLTPDKDHARIITPEHFGAWAAALGDHAHITTWTEKDITDAANGIAATAYRETIDGIIGDVKQQIADGDITDRDAALEYIEQTIDGHHDVIYTHAAQEVLRQSRNDGAYFEDFGSEGAVVDGSIEWSKLAYCALRADVMEEIDGLEDWFKCQDCGGTVDAEDLKLAGLDDLPTCAGCRAEADGDAAETPNGGTA